MNPHLIYNSLGIQSLVQTKNYNKGRALYVKFSEFVECYWIVCGRMSSWIKLELLSAYLEIEKIRFNDRFKYNLYTDPKQKRIYIYIPNMLIQPFK